MLRPMRMVRLEVVAPIQETEKIIRTSGELGITNFIDITRAKEAKYKTITEEVRRVDRENLLLQLSNRINNLIKRLEQVPFPQPLPVEGSPTEFLKEIDGRVARLEEDYAKIENALKNIAEEKTSLEREIRQLQDEHSGLKKMLSDSGVNLSTISRTEPSSLGREKVKVFYEKFLEIQKTLTFVDMAGRLSSPHEHVPNDESSLREMDEMIKKTASLNRQVREELPKASGEVGKIEEIINSVKEVVERKLEAIGKLNEAKSSDVLLGKSIEEYRQNLTPTTLELLGKYKSPLDEAVKALGMLGKAQLGSAEAEELAKKTPSIVHDIRGYVEILENLEKYSVLDATVNIISEIRGGKIEDIKVVFEESKELLKHLPLKRLQTVEKAFEILYSEHRLKTLAEQPEKFKEDLYSLAKNADYVHAYKEVVEIELAIESVFKNLRQTGKTGVLEVWVGKADLSRVVGAIEKVSPSAVVNVTKEEKGDKVPTLIRNPKMAKPFQKLVTSYGLPNYREIDPTMMTVITFPILFGMMFGDMGHGLIILIGGIFLNKIWDALKFKGDLWDIVREGRNIIIASGICSIVFGFFYGEFLGPTSLEFAETQSATWPTWYSIVTGLTGAPTWNGHRIIPSPLEDMMPFFKLTILIGIVHIMSGIVIDAYNKISAGEKKEAIAPLSWIWFYGSLSYMFIAVMGPQLTPREVILDPKMLVILIFGPFAGMLMLHKLVLGSFMEAFSEAAAKFIESISNTFSYARLLALGAAHGIFGKIALMGTGGNPAMFWGLFFIITLFMVIALEGILSFAHSLRLHWVEWFSKFYRGDGSPFESFTIQRRFTVAK